MTNQVDKTTDPILDQVVIEGLMLLRDHNREYSGQASHNHDLIMSITSPAAPLSPTWGARAEERRDNEDGADPGWGISRLEGSGTWALIAWV